MIDSDDDDDEDFDYEDAVKIISDSDDDSWHNMYFTRIKRIKYHKCC